MRIQQAFDSLGYGKCVHHIIHTQLQVVNLRGAGTRRAHTHTTGAGKGLVGGRGHSGRALPCQCSRALGQLVGGGGEQGQGHTSEGRVHLRQGGGEGGGGRGGGGGMGREVGGEMGRDGWRESGECDASSGTAVVMAVCVCGGGGLSEEAEGIHTLRTK